MQQMLKRAGTGCLKLLSSVSHMLCLSASKGVWMAGIAVHVVQANGRGVEERERESELHGSFTAPCRSESEILWDGKLSIGWSQVELVREFNGRAITLAIGDGANDVSMIQGAQVGIGACKRAASCPRGCEVVR